MKSKILIILILFSINLFSQNLPTNPKTGLISISDSLKLKEKSLQEVKDVLQKWGVSLMDVDNLKRIYKLNNSKQTEMIFVSLPVGSVLTIDKGNNRFLINGTLTYSKVKSSALIPSYSTGAIKFTFLYAITTKKLTFEFTNLEYSPDGIHYGKFEEDSPPKDVLNRSFLLKMSKKELARVKEEYYNNLKILNENLKEYVTNLLQNNSSPSDQSLINYETYKIIKTGMSFDEVVKIFGDEGKELSNGSSQVNGKTVTIQTNIWYDLDKTKNITISFTNGKVSSKSQNNL